MQYLAYLHKDPQSDYGVSFPDFPGCISAGETLDEVRWMAEEALSMHIQSLLQDGELLPEASTLYELLNDPSVSVAAVIAVRALPLGSTGRTTATF